MVLFCLFLLIFSLTVIFLLSPTVIRYARDKHGEISLHFVFFSLSFYGSSNGNKKKRTDKKGTKKRQTANAPRAVFRALMRAHPHIEICLYSLPLPTATSPDKAALLIGAYYALISAASLPFGRLTADPLLDAKTKPAAPLDCRIKIRTCDFLYTFLVFLVQYRKEKEAKTHG